MDIFIINPPIYNLHGVAVLSESIDYKPGFVEVLATIVLFILWTIPALFIDKPNILILGIPVLWLYYILVSITTSIVITLLYIYWERRLRV
jgi:hypothetical protein